MRPIKFRGREYKTGKYIFGTNYAYFPEGAFGTIFQPVATIGNFNQASTVVDLDSVAQLVGYDKNEKEVYEGDTLIDENGFETVVDYRDNPDFVHLHTLKEVSTPR